MLRNTGSRYYPQVLANPGGGAEDHITIETPSATIEASLSWSQRNYRLVMHSTRLGQLCRELEQRAADDVLEIIRAGLLPLWD